MPNTVTLYHNPRCSTSRNALAMLRERGIEPQIVEYLKTPLSRDTLAELGQALGSVRALLRTKEPLCKELRLDGPQASDDQILDAIAAHPVLFNRPIVQSDRGAWVARPVDVLSTVSF